NPATRNVDDQVPGGLDFRQHGTDTRDPDAIFQGVAKGADSEYSRLWGQAGEAKAKGDAPRAVFSYIGALGVKAGWGAFEGATFAVRPWNWAKAGEGAVQLATDEKARAHVASQF